MADCFRLLVLEDERYQLANHDLHHAHLFPDGHILAIRSERQSLFRIGLFSNKALLAAVGLTIVLQLALLYVSELREVFRTTALSPVDLAATAGLAAVIFCAVELEKWFLQRKVTR